MSGDDAPPAADGGAEGTTYAASSFEPTPAYTQTRYDPSTMSRTDVDVVMEDIEQQLSLRPADERANRDRDKKLLLLFVLLASIGIAVGVTISQKNKVSNEGTASAANGGGRSSSVILAAPPDYITSVCSPDMLALASGRDKCEELCEVAVCCFVAETESAVSCVEKNEDVCREYVAVCGNLDAAPPPAETDGGTQGINAGGSVEGVTDTDGTADRADDSTAEEEEETQSTTGDDETQIIDDLKSAIESSCKEDVIASPAGSAACEALCGPASCCFSSNGSKQSCDRVGSNGVPCTEYAACVAVYPPGDDDDSDGSGTPTSTEAAKEDVDAKCKGDDGLEQCQSICEQAACCFAHGDDYCLNAGLDVDCVHFSACEVLHREEWKEDDADDEGTGDGEETDDEGAAAGDETVAADGTPSTEVTKEDVDAKCKGDATLTATGLEQCNSICEPAACCFAHGDDYCLAAGIAVDCVHFSACEVLHRDEWKDDDANADADDKEAAADDTQTEVTKEDVDAQCKGDDAAQTTAEGLEGCNNICEPAACCFAHGDEYCLTAGIDVDCVHFSACEVLHRDEWKDDANVDDEEAAADDTKDTASDGGATTGGEEETTKSATKAQIDEACLQDLTDQDWKLTCEENCLPGKCCFDTAPEPTCDDDDDIMNCADFASCSRVFQDGAQDSVRDILVEACSKDSLAMPGGDTACEDACQGSECCFDDPDTCGASIECDDYELCSAVMEGNGDDEPPAEQTDAAEEESELATAEMVIDKCSSTKLQSELGREGCEKECINHLCCFATENDCQATLGNECLEYAACKNLVDWAATDAP